MYYLFFCISLMFNPSLCVALFKLMLFSVLFIVISDNLLVTLYSLFHHSVLFVFVFNCISVFWTSLVAQRLKHLPAMRETWVRSLGWEDPLEEGVATHSSILTWRIPHGQRSLVGYRVGWQRVGHD